MLHYSSGKLVVDYKATLINVIHVHKVCIDWYVIFRSVICLSDDGDAYSYVTINKIWKINSFSLLSK